MLFQLLFHISWKNYKILKFWVLDFWFGLFKCFFLDLWCLRSPVVCNFCCQYFIPVHCVWSTWVNLIFSILTNCNFAFAFDFFSQKDTLALKVKKYQKEILDSLNTPKNNEILYIFLPLSIKVINSKNKDFSFFLKPQTQYIISLYFLI